MIRLGSCRQDATEGPIVGLVCSTGSSSESTAVSGRPVARGDHSTGAGPGVASLPVRMTFGVDDEKSFYSTRDELLERFAETLTQDDGCLFDVQLALDRKWG